jgi:uncharacterized protein (TIGR03083 family)
MIQARKPGPILVSHLFPELVDNLVALLSSLSTEEWKRPTVCEGWSVKDVAQHLLGIEVGILSRKRDRFSPAAEPVRDSDELVALINDLNATWVGATRRISPRLLCDLLEFTGRQVCEYFASLDPYALGGPVSWAGPEPAPVWLDLAREYTERWHHQQHIRDAVGRPGLKEPRYFAPVLDAFVRALPQTFRHVEASDGTLLSLTISGQSGGQWFLLKNGGKWNLFLDVPEKPHAQAIMDEDVAWRVFTKGLDREWALTHTTLLGDRSLGLRVLDTVSIIA